MCLQVPVSFCDIFLPALVRFCGILPVTLRALLHVAGGLSANEELEVLGNHRKRERCPSRQWDGCLLDGIARDMYEAK